MADEYGAEFDTEGDVLGTALEELAKHIEPLGSNAKFLTSLSYLLLLWASFEVYQLEPFVPLNEDEEGGEGGAKIISLANGWKIFDYGYHLCTSPGENYGTYCTGKLLEATKEIIEILSKRGARKVGLSGHTFAKRVAYVECVEKNIDVINYHPAVADVHLRERIRELRERNKPPEERRRPL